MPKLKIVKAPPDRSGIGTALTTVPPALRRPHLQRPDIREENKQSRKEPILCQQELDNGKVCGEKAIRGTTHCRYHTTPGEKAVTAYEYTRAPQVMDVFNAYTESMNDEDKEFMLQVYGDWNLDPEIALLRLAIKSLLTHSDSDKKLDHLPRLVQSLTAAIREAVGMVEGSRMVVDFGSRAGRTYWKELFRAFQSMVEEVHTQLCPQCQETIQNFVHGGTENVPQFSVIDVHANSSS